MNTDHGSPVHYSAIERGTPVYAASGERVGTVRQMVDNYREHILDGFVIDDSAGTVRFVDAPEVERTFERAVTLTIGPDEVAELPPPEDGPGVFGANAAAGKVSRLFGGGWKKR